MSRTTELAMWRTLRGRGCNICGEAKTARLVPALTIYGNPIRVLAYLGHSARDAAPHACQKMLKRSAMTLFSSASQVVVADVLAVPGFDLSTSCECPLFLLQALPFAIVNDEDHVISHTVLRNNSTPSSLRTSKKFFELHLEDIKKRFKHAKGT